MAKDDLYHAKDGTTSPLATADDVATALSDLSLRLLALETAPRDTGGTVTADPALKRLVDVLEPYFGAEFIAYDRARTAEDADAARDANTGTNGQQATNGNGQAAAGGATGT